MPGTFDPEQPVIPKETDLQPPELLEGYIFAANPCAEHNGKLYVEVMVRPRERPFCALQGSPLRTIRKSQ